MSSVSPVEIKPKEPEIVAPPPLPSPTAPIDINDLCSDMITKIEKFGTIEGFSDEHLMEILKKVTSIMEPLPAFVEVQAPVVVFGDLHGQLADFLHYTKIIGRPPRYQFLLLGDYADRSSHSLELIFWLFCTKIQYPTSVHMLRGNHEIRRVNSIYGMYEEICRKRDLSLFKLINDVFAEMPVIAAINRKILCMHGGMSPKIDSWKSLEELKKPRAQGECETQPYVELLWADPNAEVEEFAFNRNRGIGSFYGKATVEKMCDLLDIEMIIRGHEVKMKGHQFQFSNRLLTLFSAPYYSANYPNLGSCAKISKNLKLQIVTLKPKVAYETQKKEKEAAMAKVNSFDPKAEDQSEGCRSYMSPTSQNGGGGVTYGTRMFAHESRNCSTATIQNNKLEFVSLSSLHDILKKVEIDRREVKQQNSEQFCTVAADSKE